MSDPHQDPNFHWQWWHNLFGSPLLLLWSRRVRKFIVFWDKEQAEENGNKDAIFRPEYEARQKEVMDGQREIRELIISSEDRMQAAFHGSVQEHKTALRNMDERWDNRLSLLEKTFLDDRLRKS